MGGIVFGDFMACCFRMQVCVSVCVKVMDGYCVSKVFLFVLQVMFCP